MVRIAAVLAATILAFLPLVDNGFVNWDDPFTLLNNRQLAAPGVVKWAFTTTAMGHYQPLSWLVWSLVKSTFGPSALAFHGLSLAGHLLNTVLIYFVCVRLASLAGLRRADLQVRPTSAAKADLKVRPTSAAVAAALAFGVHPVRVEPVAWTSAFPYVLSLTFLLAAFLAYLSYCTSAAKTGRQYVWLAVSLASYALSLLARASAVGFPLVLLAVDVYPLRRAARPRRVMTEKIAFAVVALAAVFAESRARELATLQEVGLGARLTMAASAPFVYLGRTLLPVRLSPLDPLPIAPQLEWVPLLLSLTALAATAFVAWKIRRRWTAVVVGCVAYVVLLAPVIGLTPSGQQATADRYMYVPGAVVSLLIGVAIADLALVGRRRWASVPLLLGLLIAAGAATWRQTTWWHDSITLWTRAADLDPQNDIATYNLAIALAEAGREEEALRRYEQTLRLVPDHEHARHNLNLIQAAQAEREGDRLAEAGHGDEAIDLYSRALVLDPRRNHARTARGMTWLRRERYEQAADDLRLALETGVDDIAVVNSLAFALVQTGRSAEAAEVLRRARAEHPDDVNLAHNFARLVATAPDPAVRDGATALRLALEVRDRTGGRDPRVLDTLAAAYAAAGQPDVARATAEQAARLARELGDAEMAAEISAHARSYKRPAGRR